MQYFRVILEVLRTGNNEKNSQVLEKRQKILEADLMNSTEFWMLKDIDLDGNYLNTADACRPKIRA